MTKTLKKLRDIRLDALRGCFLILMTAVHVPTPVSHFLHEPLGPNGAAEGFVFLSACLTGLIFGGVYGKSGWRTMSARIWRRTRQIYYIHLGMLLSTALIILVFASQIEPLVNHFRHLFINPWRTLTQIPLLLYQPSLFDILPLYIVFLGITPLALLAARRYGWKIILTISLLAWLAAQNKPLGLVFGENWSVWLWTLPRPGSFDLFAWQLLWFGGLAIGETYSHKTFVKLSYRRLLIPLSLAIILMGAITRHQLWPQAWLNPSIFLLMDKWTLGPLRLLNFAAWCVLLMAWNPRPPSWILAAPALLGRHSLAVFSAHLPLVMVAATVLQLYTLSAALKTIIGLLLIAVVFLVAAGLERRRIAPPKSSEIPSPANTT